VQRALAALAAVALLALVLGLVFAGSSQRLAGGVRIAGVGVGGLSPDAARQRLEARARAVAHAPVVFTAAAHSWPLRASQLDVRVDWRAAVELARRDGDGFGPFRGFRRLGMRVFGADVTPPTRVYDAALQFELRHIARAVDTPHREAALVLRRLTPVVVPGQTGRRLDRAAAARTIVGSLAGFARGRVALPVAVDRPTVTATELAPALTHARIALSAPLRLRIGAAYSWLPQTRLAPMLTLPHDGSTRLSIGGPSADRYWAALRKAVEQRPRDAGFDVGGPVVRVIPARAGRTLDVPATARNLLRAAASRDHRVAAIVMKVEAPARTTAEARAMGIRGLVSGYETIYGGDPNRIHNVQLVARLLDGHLIAPGAEFSFNRATGDRNAAKGFLEAPVIINGELKTGLGGGVCQVSTTVFNAAYEAGLEITARTNHALYISHYPLGRDATVDYPNVDLRFVNDTGRWLLLRTFVGSSSLVVNLYGTPTHRRVVSDTQPLRDVAAPPVTRVPDPTLLKGQTVVESSGEPSRATSVRRRVYGANGKLVHEDTFYSSYRAEPAIVRVGTKALPKPKAKPPPKAKKVKPKQPPPPPPKPVAP
jgi:vancomycin resistance protein YoaR